MARIGYDLSRTLEKHSKRPLKSCDVLDIGCGSGRVSLPIKDKVKSLTGVDRNRAPLFRGKNIRFINNDIFDYIKTGKENKKKFDIILCSEVIEHLEDRQESFPKQLRTFLKDDGMLYLTTNNRYWWKEGHYSLPFLTYLPKFMQKRYIALFSRQRGDKGDLRLFSYSRLKRVMRDSGYDAKFITPEGLRFPYSMIRYIMKGLMWNFSVGFVVIARKRQYHKNPHNRLTET